MKKLLPIILIFLNLSWLFSIPQNIQTAKIVAANFLQNKGRDSKLIDVKKISERGQNSFFIFNYLPRSFVIISSDNDITPVIAYSFDRALDVANSRLVEIITNDISLRMKYYQDYPHKTFQNRKKWEQYVNGEFFNRDFQQWPAAGSTSTDGWIETNWNQSGVFDDFCPLDNSGSRSKVGCVATAMAQIVNFHRFLGSSLINFDNSDDYYAGGGIDIDDDYISRDFPSFPQLNGYLMDLWNHYEYNVDITDADKAALSFACGVSVEMNYSSSGSSASTSDVGYNLRNKFDFDDGYYYSISGVFYDILQLDMVSMRPAQLSIYNSDQGIGHSIVCDGYNTDEYFHLNMGWGVSNETCWYLLPSEIPDGYNIVNGGVLEIEGGEIPVYVTGNVNIVGASTPGTYITLEGESFYESFVTLFSGDFEFPAVEEGNYIATAILTEDERHFYQSFEVFIDENNNFLQFDLGHFEGISGTISAPISPEGTNISIYYENELINSGNANSDGTFIVPNILPGEYTAIASLNGNFFEEKPLTVTLENQSIDFDLTEFPGNFATSYANYPVETWQFVPNYTLTCAVKFTEDELQNYENGVISKIKLKSPIDFEDGEMYAQIWIDDYLISETLITEFSLGEWLEIEIDNFIPVSFSSEFYIGYKITSASGEFVYHDDGPRVDGKGAFYRNTGWTELPAINDYNFCIDAVIIAQDFGSISGNIELTGTNRTVEDAVVKTESFVAHPDINGDYQIDLPAGDYDLNSSLYNFTSDVIEGLTVVNGQILEDQNFILEYNVNSNENEIPILSDRLTNYPNPFNPETTIYFETTSLRNTSARQANSHKEARIEIYNLKGQKVRTLDCIRQLQDAKATESLSHSVIWDGTDDEGKSVTSGVYLYQLKVDDKSIASKKCLLLK